MAYNYLIKPDNVKSTPVLGIFGAGTDFYNKVKKILQLNSHHMSFDIVSA